MMAGAEGGLAVVCLFLIELGGEKEPGRAHGAKNADRIPKC
jgi:hypothetical protein